MVVILTVLKITAIVLIVILSLILLLALAILFVPIRYRAVACRKSDAEVFSAGIVFSWLLSLIRLEFYYKDELTYVLRVLGIPIKRSGGKKKRGGNSRRRRGRRDSQPEAVIKNAENEGREDGSGPADAYSKETGPADTYSKETDPEALSSQESDTADSNSKESDTADSYSEETDPMDMSSGETDSTGTSSGETDPMDTSSGETDPTDTSSGETDSEVPYSKETDTEAMSSIGSDPAEPSSKQTDPEPAASFSEGPDPKPAEEAVKKEKKPGSGLLSRIPDFCKKLLKFMVTLPKKIFNFFAALTEKLLDLFAALLEKGLDAIAGLLEKTVDLIAALLEILLAFLPDKLERICDIISALFKRFKAFRGRLAELIDNAEFYIAFLDDANTREQLKNIRTETFKLMDHIKPKKMNVIVVAGSDDPEIAGQILAALAVGQVFLNNRFCVTPCFERDVLDFDITMRGRAVVFVLLLIAGRVFLNKGFKQMRSAYKNRRI